MNSIQYEELCRLFIADKFELSIEEVQSIRIPNPKRADLPEYSHQIDLYWEDGNEVVLYLNIANAKWRTSDKVDQPEVLLLQKVREKVAANKAVMITNTGFTKGAEAAAKDDGIALDIVCPSSDLAILDIDLKDRKVIQTQLQELSANGKEVYTYQVIHRAVDSGTDGTKQTSAPGKTVSHSKEIKQAPINRMAQPTSHQKAPSGSQKAQGGQGGPRTAGRGGAVQKGTGTPRGGGGGSNRGR